ncbi:MAG: hypothetical protein ACPGRG_15205, partial [Marinomonas sp.]
MKPALPIRAPLDMPRHDVNEASQARKLKVQHFNVTTFLARLFVLASTLALSWYGATEMYDVLNTNAIAG